MIADVALSLPIAKTFSYSVPEKWQPFIERFKRVRVPFHNKTIIGFITELRDADGPDLKEISDIIDIYPLIDDDIINLCQWASNYYITPLGLVLKYAVPMHLSPEKYLKISAIEGIEDNEKIMRIDSKLLDKAFREEDKYNILRYLQEGFIALKDIFTNKGFAPFSVRHVQDNFSAEKILITGSLQDRTEYYLDSIEEHLRQNKNILMLLPDYNISGRYFHNLLTDRFGERVYWYGTSVKNKSRMEAYFRARNERGNIILGNQSCVFMPITDLSLIIVERHEEDSYRNESGFRFNSWELAIQRGMIEGVPVVFGSVAPKLDIYRQVKEAKFRVIEKKPPVINKISELKIDKKLFFSGALPEEFLGIISRAVEDKEDIAIYTPRKHYSSHIQCMSCKTFFTCPACNGILGYKKKENKTVCPVCQKEFDYSERCPKCRGGFIKFSQIGAEYLEEMIGNSIKGIEVVKITGDNIMQSINSMQSMDEGQPRIIVGTQSLTKLYGVNLKKLLIFGLEETLNIAGYRAEEKMFQIFMNLLDALNPAELYFFTDIKKDFSLSRFMEFKRFYDEELKKRHDAEFPPFTRLFLLEIKKKNQETGERIIKKVKKAIQDSGLSKNMAGLLLEKRDKKIWRVILKGKEDALSELLFSLYDYQGIRIEADPLNI